MFGWVALAAAVVLCLLVVSVRRGILGRRMLAVRSNERAAAGAAIDVRNVKLIAFGISALIAGVAGTLYAYNFGSVSADRFSVPLALSLIAFAYAGGITLVSGAVFAGLDRRAGDHPVRARQVVRPLRELVPALRRPRPHLHADPESRGRGRLLLPDGAGAGEAKGRARGVGTCEAA